MKPAVVGTDLRSTDRSLDSISGGRALLHAGARRSRIRPCARRMRTSLPLRARRRAPLTDGWCCAVHPAGEVSWPSLVGLPPVRHFQVLVTNRSVRSRRSHGGPDPSRSAGQSPIRLFFIVLRNPQTSTVTGVFRPKHHRRRCYQSDVPRQVCCVRGKTQHYLPAAAIGLLRLLLWIRRLQGRPASVLWVRSAGNLLFHFQANGNSTATHLSTEEWPPRLNHSSPFPSPYEGLRTPRCGEFRNRRI